MTDQLVSFETAKLAKEKGFDEECSHYYDLEDSNKLKHTVEGFKNPNEDCMVDIELEFHNHVNFKRCAAPTQSLLQKWLREKHNIDIIIEPNQDSDGNKYYYWRIRRNMFPSAIGNIANSYEEAFEASLIETLKLIS